MDQVSALKETKTTRRHGAIGNQAQSELQETGLKGVRSRAATKPTILFVEDKKGLTGTELDGAREYLDGVESNVW